MCCAMRVPTVLTSCREPAAGMCGDHVSNTVGEAVSRETVTRKKRQLPRSTIMNPHFMNQTRFRFGSRTCKSFISQNTSHFRVTDQRRSPVTVLAMRVFCGHFLPYALIRARKVHVWAGIGKTLNDQRGPGSRRTPCARQPCLSSSLSRLSPRRSLRTAHA